MKAVGFGVNQMYDVFDDKFPKPDKRNRAAKLHRHLTANLSLAQAAKWSEINYYHRGDQYDMVLPEPNSRCELCEGGDMIPCDQRFKNSKYKPGFLLMKQDRIRSK